MFTALISFIAAVSIQIYHFQVPVVAGQDVPVAYVTVPEGVDDIAKYIKEQLC